MKWYYSPSSQQGNVVQGFNEETYWNEIADRVIPIMQRHGEQCRRNNRKNTFAIHVIEANAWPADFIVPMHSNAHGHGEWQTEFSGITLGCSNPLDPKRSGTILSQLIYNELAAIFPTKGHGLTEYTFAEVTATTMPCAYIEGGYHDNFTDQSFLLTHKMEIAIAICKGCLKKVGKVYDKKEEISPMYRIEVTSKWRNKVYATLMLTKIKTLGATAKIVETQE